MPTKGNAYPFEISAFANNHNGCNEYSQKLDKLFLFCETTHTHTQKKHPTKEWRVRASVCNGYAQIALAYK